MTGKIAILPEETINKIAAGEVIERPASIVKELLENSIDAGATDITVELGKGGCGSIRVIDNGEGIEHTDVPLAFDRHATSKIYQIDDLLKIQSYGFRGEALPSIASISRVEMTTRKKNHIFGTRIIIEAGQIKEITETGCPEGTSIIVSKIFEPVPVRKRYLKSEATEQGHCVDIITKTALANYNVKLRVVANGKDILNIPSTNSLWERIPLVFGAEFMNQMLPVEMFHFGMYVRGVISNPKMTRSNTRHMYFFVNGRYVRDYYLHHAVMSAYRSIIDAKRYPLSILFIDIPRDELDANVHPAKLEVRFSKPRDVYDATVAAIKSAFTRTTPYIKKEEAANISLHDTPPSSNQQYSSKVEEAIKKYTIFQGSGKLLFEHVTNYERRPHNFVARPMSANSYEADEGLTEKKKLSNGVNFFTSLEFLGQIENQYLLFSSTDGLIIIDQHAAHERILFERFKHTSQKGHNRPVSQPLLMPEIVSLSPGDFSYIMDYIEIFKGVGYEVEPFGGNSVVIKAVPVELAHVNIAETITDSIHELSIAGRAIKLMDAKEKILKVLSCKGAVTLNSNLTRSEVSALQKELDSSPYNLTCPHGRPIYVIFGFSYLSKLFKRK